MPCGSGHVQGTHGPPPPRTPTHCTALIRQHIHLAFQFHFQHRSGARCLLSLLSHCTQLLLQLGQLAAEALRSLGRHRRDTRALGLGGRPAVEGGRTWLAAASAASRLGFLAWAEAALSSNCSRSSSTCTTPPVTHSAHCTQAHAFNLLVLGLQVAHQPLFPLLRHRVLLGKLLQLLPQRSDFQCFCECACVPRHSPVRRRLPLRRARGGTEPVGDSACSRAASLLMSNRACARQRSTRHTRTHAYTRTRTRTQTHTSIALIALIRMPISSFLLLVSLIAMLRCRLLFNTSRFNLRTTSR